MKINIELIKKIFSGKLKINKNDEKIKLSRFEEYIPMYDIYSEKIYPISKKNLYTRLIYNHYRFINQEVYDWISNKYKKNKYENDKQNLEILKNYNIEILYETSLKTVFKNSSELGLSISICKRNSFNKFFNHITPYYSRDELIKLGLNMGVIKEKDKIDIQDSKVHYEICKKISKNDFSFEEILENSNYIIDKKLISLISFYSFMGSYFMNNLLRTENNPDISNPYYKMIQKLSLGILNSPKLNNEYFIYRFIWDDFFIRNLKIGEVFEDKGFISTTRDPFYSPNNEVKFGIVLAKIKIKPSLTKSLLIENFSLFPKEQEILLIPNTQIKLVSKDENFKYFHVNENYQKNITKKYEFELIGNNFKEDKRVKYVEELEPIMLSDDSLENYNSDKIGIINDFIKKYKKNSEKIKFDNFIDIQWYSSILNQTKSYKIFYHWFDGTDSYELFYKNKNKDGMFFIIYDEFYYPYINIEFGDKMIINNLNKYYYYDDKKRIDTFDFLFIVELAKIFRYPKFELNGEYENFSKMNKNISNNDYKIASYTNLYNNSLYDYIKNKKIFYEDISKNTIFKNLNLFNLKLGYWKIDKLEKSEIPDELKNKFEEKTIKSNNLKDFIIEIIENHMMFYPKLKEYYKNIFDELYIEFDVNLYLRNIDSKYLNLLNQDIPYSSNSVENDPNFKMVFRQIVRRIV